MRKQKKPFSCREKNVADQPACKQGRHLAITPAMHMTASCQQKQQSPLAWALSVFCNPAALGLTKQFAEDFANGINRLRAIQVVILSQTLCGLITVITDQWFSLFVVNT